MDIEWKKHKAISELLGIDLKCPHCEEVLERNEESREEEKSSSEIRS